MRGLVYLGLLPGLLLMIYVYRQDKVEKEPIGLLILLLFGGVLSGVASFILENILEIVAYRIFEYADLYYYIFEAFVVAGLVEEGTKHFFLKCFSWKSINFNCSFDGIIYATFVSLGFATAENVLYVISYGYSTGIMRALTSVPGHTAFGVVMGIFYAYARYAYNFGRKDLYHRNMFLSLLLPTLIHGLYDFCLFVGSDLLLIVWFCLVVFVYIILFVIVKKKANNDQLII